MPKDDDGEWIDGAMLDDWRDRDERQRNRIAELEDVVRWYGEQARLCRLIHSEGTAGRVALSADGGERAASVLSKS